jgi:hypothetical protein
MAGTAMPVTRWHLKNAAAEAVRWDGSEAVRDVLREWGADPDAFPGPPLRVWGARDGYAGALLGDWLVRDPTAGAARYVPGLFTAAFEAPAVPDAALVPVGELGAFGVLLERTHQAITDATARIDAEVAKAVEAERERIRGAVADLKFTLFRPANGPADTQALEVVPLGELLGLLGPQLGETAEAAP